MSGWRDLVTADLMSEPAVTISPEHRLRIALREMQLHGWRHLPVVDGHGGTIGMLSERDVWRAAARGTSLEARVGDVMSRRLYALGADAPILDAVDIALGQKLGALPIERNGERLVGIVTRSDLLGLLWTMLTGRAPGAPPRC